MTTIASLMKEQERLLQGLAEESRALRDKLDDAIRSAPEGNDIADTITEELTIIRNALTDFIDSPTAEKTETLHSLVSDGIEKVTVLKDLLPHDTRH